jgi:hypothetical protein
VRREGLLKDVHDHMSIALVIPPPLTPSSPPTALINTANLSNYYPTFQDLKDADPEIEAVMAVSLEVLHSITVLRSLYESHY